MHTRRDILRAGALATLGLSLPALLRGQARAADTVTTASSRAKPAKSGTAKSCILVWLDGGPSHLDLFDLKPDAPAEVRGPFKPMATAAPGIQICEYLPRLAQQMRDVAIIRSMTHPLGEHNFGAHYMLTGYKPTPALQYPSLGSVLAHTRGTTGALPAYVAVPDANPEGRAGFLPAACRPFEVGGDPSRSDFRVRDLDAYPGVDAARLARRHEFLAAFDAFERGAQQVAANAAPSDPQLEQAYRLLTSPAARKAFDLTAEPAALRQKYGHRAIGQGCLLARRLVEAGVPLVTVTDRTWDTHESIYNRLKEGYTGGSMGRTPMLDLAVGGLLEDLRERGLLDSTLVLVMGEFGRTPRINTMGGRDHWPRVFSMLMAGGGVRGGQVIGASDSRGESPAERPVAPAELTRTVYRLLGVDPDAELHTSDGRPVRVSEPGDAIAEVLG